MRYFDRRPIVACIILGLLFAAFLSSASGEYKFQTPAVYAFQIQDGLAVTVNGEAVHNGETIMIPRGVKVLHIVVTRDDDEDEFDAPVVPGHHVVSIVCDDAKEGGAAEGRWVSQLNYILTR